jgi:Flp pilus assembly protein TadD
VLEKQGKYQDAIQALNESVALDPAYPEPHYVLGRIYQRSGQGRLAKTEIERFQQLDKARPSSSVVKSPSPPN